MTQARTSITTMHLLPVLLIMNGIIAVGAWRWFPQLAALPSLTCLLGSWLLTARNTERAHKLQPWFIGIAGATVAVRFIVPAAWECEWHCRMPRFASAFGIPLEWFAMAAFGAWMCAALGLPRINRWAGWGMAGVSGFYLGVLAVLEQPCTLCLAAHTALLAAVLLGHDPALSWARRISAIVGGAVLTAALHGFGAPPPPPAPIPIDPSGMAPPPLRPAQDP